MKDTLKSRKVIGNIIGAKTPFFILLYPMLCALPSLIYLINDSVGCTQSIILNLIFANPIQYIQIKEQVGCTQSIISNLMCADPI